MADGGARKRLTSWLARQLPGADDVRLGGLDRVEVGHSAETLLLTVEWRADGADHRTEAVLRLRPAPPGLLEPYDLKLQYDILRGLAPTPVRAPRALWYEGSGEVLGREFYVMERLPGAVFERTIPDELTADPARVRRMAESMIDQLAAIHLVDLEATGLARIGDGRDFLTRDLDHWEGEIRREQRGPVPGLDRLLAELRDRQPEQSTTVTLVHGDAKPGNFAFVGDEVSAVFDWEMTTIGDPLSDIGWAEVMWGMPGSFTQACSMSADEFVTHYEQRTGIPVRHRAWYRAYQTFKMAVIGFVGSMHFDRGITDDARLAHMGMSIPWLTGLALQHLGIDEEIDPGAVAPREERLATLRPPA